MKTPRAAPAIRPPRRRRLSGAAGGNIDADMEISRMVGSCNCGVAFPASGVYRKTMLSMAEIAAPR